MTIASEIQRLQWAKSDMQTSIWNKWVVVPNTAKLDEYAWYIDQIQQGSSSWLLYYFSGMISLDSNTVFINNQDHVTERYSDYSWINGTDLYLIRPYEYYDYSSSWHSYYKTYVSCINLYKWATSTTRGDVLIYQWYDYTNTYIDYYYTSRQNYIKFYLRITGGTQDVYVWKTVSLENGTWTVTDFSWDGTTPVYRWWNQNQMKTTVVWTQGSWWQFLYRWKLY